MKRTRFLTGFILFLLCGSSCTDEFLDRNNAEWYSISHPLLLDSYHEKVAISLQIPDRINSVFTVSSRPRWLNAMTKQGTVTAGRLDLIMVVDKKNLPAWNYDYTGNVILEIEGYGFVIIPVIYTDYGSPTVYCSPQEVVFNDTLSRSFSIMTPDQGILVWEISDAPAWLSFSKTSGILPYGETDWITATIVEDKITPATEVSGIIKITSNSSAGSYLLNVRVTASTVPLP